MSSYEYSNVLQVTCQGRFAEPRSLRYNLLYVVEGPPGIQSLRSVARFLFAADRFVPGSALDG